MATVKMSGGKVVTKAGKVSCTCCAAVCCMYPAESAVAADLPDAITLLGVGSLAKSGTDYGDTTNGVILESGVWAKYLAGVRSTKACLIDDDGAFTPGDDVVEDQFLGVYLIKGGLTWSPVTGDEAVRVELCGWFVDFTGDEFCVGCSISLYYDGVLPGISDYKWHIAVETLAGGGYFSLAVKTSPDQSSPVGTYYDADNDATYTVEEP